MDTRIDGNLDAGEEVQFPKSLGWCPSIRLFLHPVVGRLEMVDPGTAVVVGDRQAIDLGRHIAQQPVFRRQRLTSLCPVGIGRGWGMGMEIELLPARPRVGPVSLGMIRHGSSGKTPGNR